MHSNMHIFLYWQRIVLFTVDVCILLEFLFDFFVKTRKHCKKFNVDEKKNKKKRRSKLGVCVYKTKSSVQWNENREKKHIAK